MAKKKATGARSAGKGKGKAKSRHVSVDFTDVDVRVHLPPGIFRAKVEEVTLETTENDNPMLSWRFRTIDKDKKLNNAPLYYNTVLVPQSLWVLGSLLDSLGVDRPEGPMDLDLDALIDQECELIVDEGEYKGKPSSDVVDFQPIREGEEDDDDDEAEVVDDTDSDSEERDTYTEEEIMAMDADELDEVVKDEELEVKALKKLSKYRTRVLEALKESDMIGDGEEDEGEDEGEEEGEEGELYSVEEIKDMGKEELTELIKTEELDVNPKKQKTLRRLQMKVIDALEEAELLEAE